MMASANDHFNYVATPFRIRYGCLARRLGRGRCLRESATGWGARYGLLAT